MAQISIPISFANRPFRSKVGEQKLPGNEYLTDRLNYEAVEFIKRHKENLFLYLSHYAPHQS